MTKFFKLATGHWLLATGYGHQLFQRLQEENDLTASPWLTTLAGSLAGIYGLGARARREVYAKGWRTVQHLPAPVLSVGNLTVGGTGKTPVTACLARFFQEQGKRVAILSRGYGGKTKEAVCLSDGERLYRRPPEVGDEAYWLARRLPGVAVYTGAARHDAGLAAWQDLHPDLFLLDDGFQHFQLHRDLDLVLLDAESPFGNGRLLPRGPLREPLSALDTAQVLILTRFQKERHQHTLLDLQKMFPDKTLLTAAIQPTEARRYPGGEAKPAEILQGRACWGFAGLAHPRVFRDTLTELGVRLAGFAGFPDHYPFTAADLADLARQARAAGAEALITTGKDFARLDETWPEEIPLWVLEVEAQLAPPLPESVLAALWGREREPSLPSAGNTGNKGKNQRSANSEAVNPVGLAKGPDNHPQTPSPPGFLGGEGRGEGGVQPVPAEVRQCWRQLQVRGGRNLPASQVRRVLLRVPNWLGDAVMGLPVLSGLRELFPQAAITILAAPGVAPLFAAQPGVAEILPYPRGPEKWRLLWGLRKKRFDLALALPNSLESALGLWLTRAPVRVGYNADGRRLFLTHPVSGRRLLTGLHTVYYLLGLLTSLGEIKTFSYPHIVLQPAERTAAGELLSSGVDLPAAGPWVGLSPGAAYGPAKRWPPERYAAVGKALQQEFGARLVLLGGPEDREAAARVKAQLATPVLDLVGRTNLRQALGVLTHLKLLVTNDSGLMHAAAALDTPLIALFGSTDPVATGPFSPRATVLRRPPDCAPCFKRICAAGYPCLTAISVAEVLTAARPWLETTT